ncbi:LCI fold-containing protein [Xenorhabdus sp. IM139775]|uniref:LCI fold-containing protein n=1 Tax=Xenorhabdus sp. IM139775 TaxID=3025876 RepID=UPI00235A3816|nr:LCI fold-containing protein [Xenorhabdus sp. IM139775]MDC9593021.1 LCI family antimicrobial peptide [Xenorhabdus sp. IM139775]
MFKKLLTVGALAAGVLLSSNAMALNPCEIGNVPKPIEGNLYQMFVVNPSDNFANSFERFGIKWYFKGKIGACKSHTGKTAYQAYYQGRK